MSRKDLDGVAHRLRLLRRIDQRADAIFEALRADLRAHRFEAEDGSRLWGLAVVIAQILVDGEMDRRPTDEEAIAKIRGALAAQLAASRSVGQAIGDVRDHLSDLFSTRL